MKNKTRKLISIIVPCFNEEEALPYFYNEFTKIAKGFKYDYELILVDDGSKDNTLNVIESLAKKDKHIIFISFSRNFGKEAAMYAGLQNAKGDYVGFIDADLQHPPVLLNEMIEKLDSGEYDCAACRRVNRTGDSKVRTFFAKNFYRIINKISDAEMIDGAGDYRLMTRNVVDAILKMPEYNRFSKGIFSWVGFRTYWIEYENVDRIAGTTSWSFWGLVRYAIDGIVNFTNAPLNVATCLGLIFSIVAFVILMFIIIRKIAIGDPVQGWTSTMCVIVFIGGIQLFCLGVLGQYIGKSYMEVKNRPHYIVAETNKKNSINIK